MQANELRIGSIVRLNNPKSWAVFQGREFTIKSMQADETGKYYAGIELIYPVSAHENLYRDLSQYLEYLTPIPITPEILEELGFEFDSDRNSFVYKVNNDYVEYYEAVSGNQLSLCCDKHNFYLPLDHITSLHQLQNFIYFTFNTELQWSRKQ